MAEYENRERNYNNGLGKVVGSFAMGIVDAHNAACDAYVARQIALMGQEEPNCEFLARTTLIGLDQALETRVSVPKIVLAPNRPAEIKEAKVTLDMTVSAHSEDALAIKSDIEGEGEAGIGVGPFSAKMRVKAAVSVAKDQKRSSDYTSSTHAELTMGLGAAPEGLMKIIDSLNANTARALELNGELIEQQYLRMVQEGGAATAPEAPAA